jgi:hypothetical protein
MKTASILLLLALTSGGCASRHSILTVPAVSMTEPSFKDGSNVGTPSGRVESTYCRGDDPVVSKDKNIGMIDEAVMIAQQQSGAKYLTDVTIYRDGDCVIVEATAMK